MIIPPPQGDVRFTQVGDNGDLRFRGRIAAKPAKAIAEISQQTVPYSDFAQLKNRLLGFADGMQKRHDLIGRGKETRIISETSAYLCLLEKPHRRERGDRKGKTTTGIAHAYLYSGIITLTVDVEDGEENSVIRLTLEWLKAVLEANLGGLDENPVIALQEPLTMRDPFIVPLPKGMMRVFDIKTQADLPSFAFYPLEEDDPITSVNATTFGLVSTEPIPPDYFKRAGREQDAVFLNLPEGRVVRRDRDYVVYSYASNDRRWEGFAMLRVVRRRLIKLDICYPYRDRRQAKMSEAALNEWAEMIDQYNASRNANPHFIDRTAREFERSPAKKGSKH